MNPPIAICPKRSSVYRQREAYRIEKYENGNTGLQCLLPESLFQSLTKGPWRLERNNKIKSWRQLNYYMGNMIEAFGEFSNLPFAYLALETVYDADMNIIGENIGSMAASVHTLNQKRMQKLQETDQFNPLERREKLNPVAQEFYNLENFALKMQKKALTLCIGTPSPNGIAKSLRIEANRGLRFYFDKHGLTGFTKEPNESPDKKEWKLKIARDGDHICGMLYDRTVDEYANLLQAVSFAKDGKPFLKAPKSFVNHINFHDAEVEVLARATPPQEEGPAPPFSECVPS